VSRHFPDTELIVCSSRITSIGGIRFSVPQGHGSLATVVQTPQGESPERDAPNTTMTTDWFYPGSATIGRSCSAASRVSRQMFKDILMPIARLRGAARTRARGAAINATNNNGRGAP
jgi:hypothetical protein